MENQYSQEQINKRSCVDFAGGIAYNGSEIKACVGITEDQVEDAKGLDILSKLEIRGGSEETRNLLLSKRSDQLITRFLNEGRDMETPIKDKYTAIWDIIKRKYSSHKNITAIALNMEQYYLGYLDFGCSLLEAATLQLRRMELSPHSTKEIPNYRCVLEREGCHKDSDCKTGVGFESNCDGQTCVEHLPAPFGFKAERARMLKEKNGSNYV